MQLATPGVGDPGVPPGPTCPHSAPASRKRSFPARGPEELLSRDPQSAQTLAGPIKAWRGTGFSWSDRQELFLLWL